MNSYLLRGDVNRNGFIDNDNEARKNTELNSVDIAGLQKELKRLSRRVNNNTVLASNTVRDNATFASTAKIAEELTDGAQRVYFNTIGKSLVFKYGNKPMTNCVQIGCNDGVIKNVSGLEFMECEPIKSFVQSREDLTEDEQKQSIPSVKVINDLVDGLSGLHTHTTDQISRKIEEEEEYEEEVFEEEEENGNGEGSKFKEEEDFAEESGEGIPHKVLKQEMKKKRSVKRNVKVKLSLKQELKQRISH